MVPWSTTGFTGKMSGLPSTMPASRPTTLSRSNAQHSVTDRTSVSPGAWLVTGQDWRRGPPWARPNVPSGRAVSRHPAVVGGREHGGLGATLHAQLGQHRRDVVLDGLLCQVHLLPDLPVRLAGGN